jgi:putative transposase
VARASLQFLRVDCGYANYADVVGAIYILARGYRIPACGEMVQPGRSMKQEPTEAPANHRAAP